VLVDSTPLTAELRPESVAFDDPAAVYRVTAEFDGRYRVEGPDGPRMAVAAIAGDRIWVGIDDDVFECRLGSPAGSGTADADALSAPMPATVTHVAVRAGQRVRAGDTLVRLEAMKMELPLRAPRDAVVSAVHCREGQIVQPGMPLLTLADDDQSA
jgi:biotin carboxyl carrier protein